MVENGSGRQLELADTATAVGIANSMYAAEFAHGNPGILDYVEVPFEQLLHAPTLAKIQQVIPVILHCASLSMAGDVGPAPAVVEKLVGWIESTRTPWIGEHLSFIRAGALAGGDRKPCEVGYTVSPQWSEPVLERVVRAVEHWQNRLAVPILLENGPVYFEVPGGTMSQAEFITEVCARSRVGLLLDLAHFYVTAMNFGFNPLVALERLPLERVVEVHISGAREQSGIFWDDHTQTAPTEVYDMFEVVLDRVRPRAVTLEYNWDGAFPTDLLLEQIERTRLALSA